MLNYSQWMPKMKPFLARIAFVFLSAMILVFFSEKVFWYTQGFKILELTLIYSLPAFLLFWVLETYRVNRFYLLVIGGALFAYLVEGVITPVLYEGGLLPLFAMPVCASLVYGISYAVHPPEPLIRGLFFHSVFACQTLLGGIAFLWSVIKALIAPKPVVAS